MVTTEKTYTVEEFWELAHLPENSDKRLELVEGRVVEMSPSSGQHGEIALWLGSMIMMHVRKHKLGRATGAETGFILNQDEDGHTLRAPDVGFVRADRAPEPLGAGFVKIVPDLAVEVVSPNDRAADIHNKISDYLQAGVAQVWIVYPEGKKIDVHTASGIERLNEGDTLRGTDVLPGFEVPVREIFDLSL